MKTFTTIFPLSLFLFFTFSSLDISAQGTHCSAQRFMSMAISTSDGNLLSPYDYARGADLGLVSRFVNDGGNQVLNSTCQEITNHRLYGDRIGFNEIIYYSPILPLANVDKVTVNFTVQSPLSSTGLIYSQTFRVSDLSIVEGNTLEIPIVFFTAVPQGYPTVNQMEILVEIITGSDFPRKIQEPQYLYGLDVFCHYLIDLCPPPNNRIANSHIHDEVIVAIAPNPFKDYLALEIRALQTDIPSIQVLDMSGKNMHLSATKKYAGNSKWIVMIPTQDLPSGVYVCKTETQDASELRKVVKY